MKNLPIVLCLILVFANSHFASAQGQPKNDTTDWTQWRGPKRDGIINAAPWPDSLSKDRLVEQWKTPLGPSYSGPLVVGDSVLLPKLPTRKMNSFAVLIAKQGNKSGRSIGLVR